MTTTGVSGEDLSLLQIQKDRYLSVRGKFNRSVILKPGTLDQSAAASEEEVDQGFDDNFGCMDSTQRLKNVRELSQRRIENNITMSIQRAEQHDSQSKFEKHQQSSQILSKMMANFRSASQLTQQESADGRQAPQDSPFKPHRPI